MTDYHLQPPQTLPTLAWQERKEKRKQLLAAIRQRRAERYKRFLQKMRLQTNEE